MKLQPNSKLVIIGDSVTDTSRAQPVGEGLFDALGRGYVSNIEALLTATYPEQNIRVVNVGTSGNNVRDLKNRWQRDVLDLKPDYLSIMIGINDVWRQFDSPRLTHQHVALDEYEATLRELVEATRPTLKDLILMTPFFIESQTGDAMRQRMDAYGAVVKKIASEHDAILVDTQAAFDTVLQHLHSAAIAWDRVHPNQAGHMILTRAFLKAIEFEW